MYTIYTTFQRALKSVTWLKHQHSFFINNSLQHTENLYSTYFAALFKDCLPFWKHQKTLFNSEDLLHSNFEEIFFACVFSEFLLFMYLYSLSIFFFCSLFYFFNLRFLFVKSGAMIYCDFLYTYQKFYSNIY